MSRRFVAACMAAVLACALVPAAPGGREACALPAGVAGLQEVAAIAGGVRQVELGDSVSAAVGVDGSLWMWGSNANGLLCKPDTGLRTSTPQRIMSNVVSVSLGSRHAAALTFENYLLTWGRNSYGQLGDGTTQDCFSPMRVMDGVTCVSLGSEHTAAVTYDGSLWTWGSNASGCLGDGGSSARRSPTRVMGGVASVTLGNATSAALQDDASLWTWGSGACGSFGDRGGVPANVPARVRGNVSAVEFGNGFSAAVTTDGKLLMCGDNSSGQLGDGGTFQRRDEPVELEALEGLSAVSLGGDRAAAVKGGVLYTWGGNKEGQLGDSALGEKGNGVPHEVMGGVESVSLGSTHSAAMTADGSLYTWGSNKDGQLGIADQHVSWTATRQQVVIGQLPAVKAAVPVPAARAGLSYTGDAQVGIAADSRYFRTGFYTATAAGTYRCTVRLVDPQRSEWADGTSGEKAFTWSIAAGSLSAARVRLSSGTFTYDGAAHRPAVSVELGGRAVPASVGYTVSWSGDCTGVGVHAAVVKGTGSLSGSATASFTILPPGSALKSLKAVKGGNGSGIKVKWARQTTQVTGYELRWSRSKGFAASKTKSRRYALGSKVGKKASLAMRLTRKWLGKRLYVQVRTYTLVGGAVYTSGWSKARSVKTRR